MSGSCGGDDNSMSDNNTPHPEAPLSKRGCKFNYNIVIAVVAYLLNVMSMFLFSTIGVLYLEYVDTFDASITLVGFITSAYCIGYNISALVSSNVGKKFGARPVAVTGALMAAVMTFYITRASSIYVVLALHIFIGAGVNAIFVGVSSSIQQHFTTMRPLANGISAMGISTAYFVFPPLTRYICDTVGWRFVPLVMSSLLLQTVWLSMLLRPKSMPANEVTETKDIHASCCKSCLESSGLHLLRNVPFSIYCFATVLFTVSYGIMLIHIVNKAIFAGIDKQKASLLLSIVGFVNLFGRAFVGVMATQLKHINRIVWCGSGILTLGLGSLLINAVNGFHTMATLCAIMAFGIAMVVTLLQVVMVELVGINNVFHALGFLLFSVGIGFLSGPPLAGFLYDISHSYDLSFYVSGAIGCAGAVLTFLVLPLSGQRVYLGKHKEEEKDLKL